MFLATSWPAARILIELWWASVCFAIGKPHTMPWGDDPEGAKSIGAFCVMLMWGLVGAGCLVLLWKIDDALRDERARLNRTGVIATSNPRQGAQS